MAAVAATFLMAACASTDTKEQPRASVEQRDLAEQQKKEAQQDLAAQAKVRKEQEELKRLLEEQRARQAGTNQADAPIVKPLPQPGVTSSKVKDAWGQLKDPASPLSKRSIYYDFDRFDIKDEFQPIVEAHARFLAEHPEMKVVVQGNCDDRGSREYNLALGQRRSDGVRRAMTLLGASEKQVETTSFGAEKPVAFGQDEESWAKNRRSDIVYSNEPQ
jgi:peptidoglycan-associated lipoprotein